MTASQKIKQLRMERGWTRKYFCEKIGYSYKTSIEWETGEPPVSLKTLNAIAEGLGVPTIMIMDDADVEKVTGWMMPHDSK